MTDQSRVEAVARGLCKKGRNDPDKVVNNLFGPDPSKKVPLWTQYRGEAQAAIEASDAWLRAHLKDLAGALGYRLGNSFGAIGDYEPETVASAAINEIVALGNETTQEEPKQ